MTPFVNDGEDVEKNELLGSGSEEEAQILDEVYNTMYDYFIELNNTVGLENYDEFYTAYFTKLKQVRTEIIGDD